jgi:hypothetical protein
VPFDGNGMSTSESAIAHSRTLFSLSAFAITDTELKLMAAAEQHSSWRNLLLTAFVFAMFRLLAEH